MTKLKQLFTRYRHSLKQLLRFGIVGGLGVLVNMLAFILANKIFPLIWSSAGNAKNVWLDLPFTDFNVRWYHVMSTTAFFVANLFNFQLNRWWTFKTAKEAPWFREYVPFLTVGLVAQGIGLLIFTSLMHSDSPLHLPDSIFDNSAGSEPRNTGRS